MGFQRASGPALLPFGAVLSQGKPIAALQSAAWAGYHIKASGAFAEIQSIFFLADQIKDG